MEKMWHPVYVTPTHRHWGNVRDALIRPVMQFEEGKIQKKIVTTLNNKMREVIGRYMVVVDFQDVDVSSFEVFEEIEIKD